MAKGGQWERTISKRLSLWLSKDERDDLFWRASQSGGRATQRAKQGKKTANSYGDICSQHSSSALFIDTFVLELKRGYTDQIKILNALDGSKKIPTIIAFWNQCEKDRIESGRAYSLVLFKRDRCKEMIVFRRSLFLKLKKYMGPFHARRMATIDFPQDFGAPALIFMRLDDWFTWMCPGKLTAFMESLK